MRWILRVGHDLSVRKGYRFRQGERASPLGQATVMQIKSFYKRAVTFECVSEEQHLPDDPKCRAQGLKLLA